MDYLQKFSKQLTIVEKIINYKYKDRRLLLRALTHRSFIHEHRNYPYAHNERLEFLGDAVLELQVTDYLFIKYPKFDEGDLTSIRATTVRTETLAMVLKSTGINKYILLSSGEGSTGGRDKVSMCANVFEAVLGSLYLDGGLKACQIFLKQVLFGRILQIVENKEYVDPKTHLQEVVQSKKKVTPVYTVVKENGPDHDKSFTCAVIIDGIMYANGIGASKKRAEEEAAQQALNKLLKIN